jgi:competence/damage-inducible protein CinA-like protein
VCEGKSAIVLSVGTELTEGIIQDSHIRYLSSELTSLGFSVCRGVQIPDNASLFRDELARAAREAAFVVVTGGLGPTADDLTREIVAEAAGVPLEFHQDVWDALVERFKGRRISDTNRKQASAPRGFPLLPNPNGTAPGFHGVIGGALVVALPGPPSELRPMFAASVVPLISERFGGASAKDLFWGTALMVPESNLEEALRNGRRAGLQSGTGADLRWGTRVDEDRIVFSLRGGDSAAREASFASLVAALGPTRIRRGETRPALLLTEALLSHGETLVTAESCTGGLIGKYMTDLPGSSRVYWGGYVSYSNAAKTSLLDVGGQVLESFGAVSKEAVTRMAQGALSRSGAGIGVAVSGIAGPDGGSAEKPVGTVWIAVAKRGGACRARLFTFSGSRDMIRRRSAVAAMLFAEAELLGNDFLDSRTKW